MCIIIDANTAHEFVGSQTEAARSVYEWVTQDGGVIASGGRLRRELLGTQFRNIYQVLLLAGRLYQYYDDVVDAEEQDVCRAGRILSNDPHIIALALVSGCRLLFSHDGNLHVDFSNRKILSPRGYIYQEASHKHLLRQAPTCKKPDRGRPRPPAQRSQAAPQRRQHRTS